jgi:hypothetical protein
MQPHSNGSRSSHQATNTSLHMDAPLSKIDKGEPMFDQVDNPWNWQEYTYTTKFETGRYIHHCIPQEPNRCPSIEMGGVRWTDGSISTMDGKVKCLQLAMEQHSCLDVRKLRKYGMFMQFMVSEDTLFSHQLLLPMCAPFNT